MQSDVPLASLDLPLGDDALVGDLVPDRGAVTPEEAVLETGMKIQVPGYLESGEKIKVDTRDGRFISRA